MSVDLQIISQLREQTGAGVGDCKKALEETGGDINLAIEVLRKSGEIKAAKKSARNAKEGLIALAKAENKISAVVLNCETDFVALNEDFIKTIAEFAEKLLSADSDEFKAWADEKIKNELIVKIGENIQLGDFAVLSGKVLGSYLHSNKKAAGVVVLSGGSAELANDIAMQIVAMAPKWVKPEDVPADVLEKEKEIYRAQLQQEGKPEQIWDKIMAGKLAKFYEDVCLLNQIYIKDETRHVADLLGEGITVIEFRLFAV